MARFVELLSGTSFFADVCAWNFLLRRRLCNRNPKSTVPRKTSSYELRGRKFGETVDRRYLFFAPLLPHLFSLYTEKIYSEKLRERNRED
ncbi:hypothetical protein HanRHA438_Chr15g0719431 [Helianthus annuus]|uniref:Uncharacterized protein n=1 Tax=Helianthus annuus TaxID=4232 RepID=A0A251SJ64_HELAN|nr:hypothetical protein HanXRQr2_Chr15g0707281 [Helianthus annuus]KAJ0452225.1 hypothetical protein HanHA300_Chr15g0576531 [Helianthus annuus]KAJ0457039.1 hypothetical protein HanIR_Chr15g0769311 [Helianthus annuus]KAJ0474124.1 hypothetical protein HanHA89_Chr15g0626161 [Helianthus annuus]KAJ0649691.1 hypothetical protein HanLR1_Chr15g0587201 [Helianthus annuus]